MMGKILKKIDKTKFHRGMAFEKIAKNPVLNQWLTLRQAELNQFQQLWNETYGRILAGNPIAINHQQCGNEQQTLLSIIDQLTSLQPAYHQLRKNARDDLSQNKLNRRKDLYSDAFNPNEIETMKRHTFFNQVETSLAVERQFARVMGKDADRIM